MSIVDMMADALWQTAFRRHWSGQLRAGQRPPLPKTPATPVAAAAAAKDLVGLYETLNGTSMKKAYAEWHRVMVDALDDPEAALDATAEHFGRLAAMASMGLMRQAPFEDVFPKIPSFEISYDGDSLVWSGGGDDSVAGNPAGMRGTNRPARRSAYAYEPAEPAADLDVYIEEHSRRGDAYIFSYKKVHLSRYTGSVWLYTDELGRNGRTKGPFFFRVSRWPRKVPR